MFSWFVVSAPSCCSAQSFRMLHKPPHSNAGFSATTRYLHQSSRLAQVHPDVQADRAAEAADEKASFKGVWLANSKLLWHVSHQLGVQADLTAI